MLKDNGTCKFLCEKTLLPANAKFMNDRIKEDYALNWIIDGLPAAEIKEDTETGETFFDMGFELGKDDGKFAEKPALHNHYDITLR
jgi:transmembrane 9 superfamily protein 2/4